MTLRSSVSREFLADPFSIAIDADGHLLVANRNAFDVSDNPFGGKDHHLLFITASKSIYGLRMRVGGGIG